MFVFQFISWLNHSMILDILLMKCVPADDEKKNGTSPWTSWFQGISAAETFACNHDKYLTDHKEKKCPDTIPSCNIRVVNTVVIVFLAIWHCMALSTMIEYRHKNERDATMRMRCQNGDKWNSDKRSLHVVEAVNSLEIRNEFQTVLVSSHYPD